MCVCAFKKKVNKNKRDTFLIFTTGTLGLSFFDFELVTINISFSVTERP